jgi:hypothetical protein
MSEGAGRGDDAADIVPLKVVVVATDEEHSKEEVLRVFLVDVSKARAVMDVALAAAIALDALEGEI